MAVSKHTRKGKPRRHTNGTFGSHMNGKKIDLVTAYNTMIESGEKDE